MHNISRTGAGRKKNVNPERRDNPHSVPCAKSQRVRKQSAHEVK